MKAHRTMLWVVMISFFTVWFVLPVLLPMSRPFVFAATLPFRNVGIFVHEMGHGLFTLLTGGSFYWFQMEFMKGGVAVTSGGLRPATLAGGLLAPTLFGALLLQASTRTVKIKRVLWCITAFFIVGVFYMIKPLFLSSEAYPGLENWHMGYLVSVSLPIGAAFLFWKIAAFGEGVQRFFVQFMGILMCYSGFSDWRYIFMFDQLPNGLYSDSRAFASMFWPGGPESVPYWLFFATAAGIMVFNLGLMIWGAWRALKSPSVSGRPSGEILKRAEFEA